MVLKDLCNKYVDYVLAINKSKKYLKKLLKKITKEFLCFKKLIFEFFHEQKIQNEFQSKYFYIFPHKQYQILIRNSMKKFSQPTRISNVSSSRKMSRVVLTLMFYVFLKILFHSSAISCLLIVTMNTNILQRDYKNKPSTGGKQLEVQKI